MTRPTLIDLNLDEYDQRLHYYPFMFNIDRCNGSCNTLVVIHETNPQQIATANSYSKQLRQIPTANSYGKFPWQIAVASSHDKSHGKKLRDIPTAKTCGKFLRQITMANICKEVSTMLLLTHLIKRNFMFYLLNYLKSWNYNTKVLVRIIVLCLNRCELLQSLKFYLRQKEILI